MQSCSFQEALTKVFFFFYQQVVHSNWKESSSSTRCCFVAREVFPTRPIPRSISSNAPGIRHPANRDCYGVLILLLSARQRSSRLWMLLSPVCSSWHIAAPFLAPHIVIRTEGPDSKRSNFSAHPWVLPRSAMGRNCLIVFSATNLWSPYGT